MTPRLPVPCPAGSCGTSLRSRLQWRTTSGGSSYKIEKIPHTPGGLDSFATARPTPAAESITIPATVCVHTRRSSSHSTELSSPPPCAVSSLAQGAVTKIDQICRHPPDQRLRSPGRHIMASPECPKVVLYLGHTDYLGVNSRIRFEDFNSSKWICVNRQLWSVPPT